MTQVPFVNALRACVTLNYEAFGLFFSVAPATCYLYLALNRSNTVYKNQIFEIASRSLKKNYATPKCFLKLTPVKISRGVKLFHRPSFRQNKKKSNVSKGRRT